MATYLLFALFAYFILVCLTVVPLMLHYNDRVRKLEVRLEYLNESLTLLSDSVKHHNTVLDGVLKIIDTSKKSHPRSKFGKTPSAYDLNAVNRTR